MRVLAATCAALFTLFFARSVDAAPERDGRFIDACRERFPGVTTNPSDSGGWLASTLDGQTFLCLYGSLGTVDLDQFNGATAGKRFDVILLRSTGGPVLTWLSLAESLVGRVDTIVVDDACFSSCANYLFPLGRVTITSENSLVVWHGGPTPLGDLRAVAAAGIDRVIDYTQLGERTTALYARLGIDVRILTQSGTPPPLEKLNRVAAAAHDSSLGKRPISGYAFSPDRLRRCYKFSNVAEMWHAGGDAAVLALGHARSGNLVVIESPFLSPAACH